MICTLFLYWSWQNGPVVPRFFCHPLYSLNPGLILESLFSQTHLSDLKDPLKSPMSHGICQFQCHFLSCQLVKLEDEISCCWVCFLCLTLLCIWPRTDSSKQLLAALLSDDQGPRFLTIHTFSKFAFCSFPGLCGNYLVSQPIIFHSLLWGIWGRERKKIFLVKSIFW